jgi:hypothetical protein
MMEIVEAPVRSLQCSAEQRIGQAAALSEPKPNVITSASTRHRIVILHLTPVSLSLEYIRT